MKVILIKLNVALFVLFCFFSFALYAKDSGETGVENCTMNSVTSFIDSKENQYFFTCSDGREFTLPYNIFEYE